MVFLRKHLIPLYTLFTMVFADIDFGVFVSGGGTKGGSGSPLRQWTFLLAQWLPLQSIFFELANLIVFVVPSLSQGFNWRSWEAHKYRLAPLQEQSLCAVELVFANQKLHTDINTGSLPFRSNHFVQLNRYTQIKKLHTEGVWLPMITCFVLLRGFKESWKLVLCRS